MQSIPGLYKTPGDSLDTFLTHSLQPQKSWKEEGQDAWHRIEKFFREQCFHDELVLGQEVKVLKVVKGGSSGKGTTLNHISDQDMVLFLSCFSSFKEQAQYRESIINFMEKKLALCSRSLAFDITVTKHTVGNRTPRSLTLRIVPKKNCDIIRMDVLPAYDALGSFHPDSKPAPEIYENLIRSEGHHGEFSPSFTELQRHFVKSRPVKLKNLLRLVKFWYLQHVRCKYERKELPPKYALELLTIYAWEKGTEKSENFNMNEGLVAVMELLRDYKYICIYWTKYYDFQNEVVRDFINQQLKKGRPIILDPADPTNNLGKKKGWKLVAKEAAYCLKQDCCKIDDPSQGWTVLRAGNSIQVTVKQTGQETWTLWVNPYRSIWKMKTKIKRKNSILGKQRLSFQEPGGDRRLLASRRNLAYYGIFSKVTIQVLETFDDQIQVFVKESSGQSRPYAVCPDSTIENLKKKIENAGGPPVKDQILMFKDQRLTDNLCLRHLKINDCATVQLMGRS